MSPNIQITDLSKKFVVFKRVKKECWYYRGRVVTSRSARKATLFDTKELAEAKTKELNVGRKAYRFRFESADKHFVNSWRFNLDHWNGILTIKNEPIAMSEVIKGRSKPVRELNGQKDYVLKQLNDRINNVSTEIATSEATYKADLERAEKLYKERTTALANKTVQYMNTKGYVQNTDFNVDFVEKYQTQLDKKTLILFGAKT